MAYSTPWIAEVPFIRRVEVLRSTFGMKRPEFRSSAGEQRDGARVSFGDLSGVAVLGTCRCRARVADLSPGGASLEVSDAPPELPRGGTLHLDVARDAPVAMPFLILRQRSERITRKVFIQVRFDTLQAPDLRLLSGLIVPRLLEADADAGFEGEPDVEVSGVERIGKLLAASLVGSRRRMRLHAGGRPIASGLPVLSVEHPDEPVLVMGAPRAPLDTARHTSFRLSFSGQFALYYFDASLLDADAQRLRFAVPDRLFLQIRRLNPRVDIVDGSLSMEFAHPRLADTLVTKHPIDLSLNGMSFPVNLDTDVLFPGERLSDVVISGPDEAEVRARAVIRSLRTDAEGSLRYGVEIYPEDNHQSRRRWGRLLFSRQYPRIALGTMRRVRENFEVLARSGYLDKVGEAAAVELGRSYERVWSRLAEDDDLGIYLFFPDPDRSEEVPIGTISSTRICSDLWAVHQFAIDKVYEEREPKLLFGALMQLTSAISTYIYATDCRFFSAEVKAFTRWNRTWMKDFLDSFRVCVPQRFDVGDMFRASRPDLSVLDPDEVARLRPATDADLDAFSALAERVLEPVEVDALDYRRSRVDLAQIKAFYARKALRRDRRIVVWEHDGVRAFAVCEVLENAVNLYGFFNRARLFLHDVPARDRERVGIALLFGARHVYQEMGELRFLVIDYDRPQNTEPDPPDYAPNPLYVKAGFRYVEALWRTLASRDLLPYFRNHMTEVIAGSIEGRD